MTSSCNDLEENYMENSKVCGHDMCNCDAVDDTSYCGDHCREADSQDMTEIKCDCGHSACN
jgi:hypothetical protein